MAHGDPKAQPQGALSEPFNPVEVAVAMRAGFVARAFAGLADHLVGIVKRALAHDGFALVDILQPSVSFTKVNTFAWYRERCREIPGHHDTHDREAAMRLAAHWGDEIPVGVIYENDRPPFERRLPALAAGPLVGRAPDRRALAGVLEHYA